MFISGMLTDTISYASISAVDSDGALSYGTPVSVKAKVKRVDELATSGDSQSATYTAEILTLAAIKRDNRVWLPGDSSSDTALAHTPISVETMNSISEDVAVYRIRL